MGLMRGSGSANLHIKDRFEMGSKILIILEITGTRTEARPFRREVGIASSSHCCSEPHLRGMTLQRQERELGAMTERMDD